MIIATINFLNVPIPALDFTAMVWFLACVFGYTAYADHFRKNSRSDNNIMSVMDSYRRTWMLQMLSRENRMVDAAIIGNLLRSITFFASTSLLVVAGMLTLLGYRNDAIDIINNLPFAAETSLLIWEIKVLFLSLIFVYAFFKYTWSLRTHHYTCIMIGAAPPHNEKIDRESYALKAGTLAANAAKHFNHGLRAYYFGLATLTWFMHPSLFMLTTIWVTLVLYRREFRSNALAGLLGQTK